MDFGYILTRSGQIMWRHKSLWILGLFGNLIMFASLITGQILRERMLSLMGVFDSGDGLPNDEVELAEMALEFLIEQGPLILLTLFGVLIVGWLLNAVAEGGLIKAVLSDAEDEPVSLGQALEDGVGLLGRFIAIDTIVFFPLFVMALVAMLAFAGGLGGFVWQASQGATFSPEQAGPIVVAILCVVLPLSVLTLPVSILSFMLRVMAFRDVSVHDLGAWATIKHAWQLIKPRFFDVFLLFVMGWALQGLLRFAVQSILSVFSIGFTFLNVSQIEQNPANLISPVWLLLEFLTAVPDIFLWTFIAIMFTVGYQQLLPDEPAENMLDNI